MSDREANDVRPKSDRLEAAIAISIVLALVVFARIRDQGFLSLPDGSFLWIWIGALVCIFIWLKKNRDPIALAIRQISLNSLIGLGLVQAIVAFLNHGPTISLRTVERIGGLMESYYFIFRSTTELGFFGGFGLIVLMSALQVRTKSKTLLKTYGKATGFIGQTSFVLAIVISFTVGAYVPCARSMTDRHASLVERFEEAEKRELVATLKKRLAEASLPNKEPLEWISQLNSQCQAVLSNRLELRDQVLRTRTEDLGHHLGAQLPKQFTQSSEFTVAHRTLKLPLTKEQWNQEQIALQNQQQRATEQEKAASAVLEIIKLGPATLGIDSGILSGCVDLLFGGWAEKAYASCGRSRERVELLYGEFVTNPGKLMQQSGQLAMEFLSKNPKMDEFLARRRSLRLESDLRTKTAEDSDERLLRRRTAEPRSRVR